MTQEVNSPVERSLEHRRHGSAAVALRRLSHPERDGRGVVEDDQVSELIRHLSEIVTFIERRTGERDDDGAARRAESVAPALGRPTPPQHDDDTGTATISLRFDTQMLSRVDAAAKRLGISRTAWLHLSAEKLLEDWR